MISIDVESPVPLEDQLCKAIREAVARNEVGAGDPLPSSRQLAADLGIHWNTVARAYRRLSDEGLLSVRRGRGVVVKPLPVSFDLDPSKLNRVSSAVREAITEARLNGMEFDTFLELVQSELGQWEAGAA